MFSNPAVLLACFAINLAALLAKSPADGRVSILISALGMTAFGYLWGELRGARHDRA